ncbi:hypothetical protein [Bradyrhizobium sp. CCBAU 53415]|uniref:hypothetical protein n=1 Tax=Bradyrhizobium sp. CCBAU 53415 TaxID=1325119 RepID=UPI002306A0E5|nr:hypothetical protein [Bradyrhizobium sp. CCBAU 53415]MDA9465334.1 hypothetical protein [Bradyrhizobium sp. CCBAU 53415]
MSKIKFCDALKIVRGVRDVAIEQALAEDATIEDIARAGLLVRKVTTFWLQYADPANYQAILHAEDEYLEALSLRLMEIDEGSDLTVSAIAADVLRPRPK